jgi:hypothetical protein
MGSLDFIISRVMSFFKVAIIVFLTVRLLKLIKKKGSLFSLLSNSNYKNYLLIMAVYFVTLTDNMFGILDWPSKTSFLNASNSLSL